MELYPIPPEIKVERKLPYLVLTIKNNNYWYLGSPANKVISIAYLKNWSGAEII